MKKQGMSYLIVGAWNTLFGYGLFVLLQLTLGHAINYMVILVASTLIAIFQAYLGHRFFVFKVEGHFFKDLSRFSLVYLAALAINLAVLPLLVAGAHIPVLLAQAFVVAGTVVGSFLAHRDFSFRRHPVADSPVKAARGALAEYFEAGPGVETALKTYREEEIEAYGRERA